MPKRKDTADDDDDSGSDVDLVNIDFEFFDPRPIDYIALKRLFNQLFQGDAESFQTHELAELILSQPLLGSTVKTDGIDSDPYAFLTVLNMNVHKDHPSIKALVSYFLAKSIGNDHAALQQLIGPNGLSSANHVGLILGERLVNMPVQVVPPMYRMLADEIQWANDEKEPYMFTHYIVVTRLYRLTASDVSEMMQEVEEVPPPNKKKKKKKASQAEETLHPGTYSFHEEDDLIAKVASLSVDYDFSNRQSREASESLGLDVSGRLMVVPASRFRELVDLMQKEYPLPGS